MDSATVSASSSLSNQGIVGENDGSKTSSSSLFDSSLIVNGLIVVALPGEDAEIFTFKREELLNYWQEWLKRLKSFGEKAA